MTRKRVGAWLIMLGCLVAGCASRQQQAAPIVKELHLTGNQALSDRQIQKKILTSATGWWPFAKKHLFDPVSWQADLKRIERLYIAHGYYQAEVVSDEVKQKPPDGVALSARISEGTPTHIGELTLEGLDPVPAKVRAEVLDELPLAKGKRFTEDDWEAAKEQLGKRLRARGYAKAKVEGRALVDVKTHQAALTVFITPGLPYRFGEIHVKSDPDAHIPPVFVWEQVRLAIAEGELYSEEALQEAERRLFGMGVFSSARVIAEDPDDATQQVALRVVVREAPFRTLRLGGGARVDQIRNEVRLISEWTNRNFHGGMRKLSLRAEAGWAFIPNVYEAYGGNAVAGSRDGPIGRLRLSFEQPRFLGRPSLREITTLESERTLEQTYNALSNRLHTGVSWQIRSRLQIYPAYHLEADYLDGPPVSGAVTSPLTLGCKTTNDECLVWLSYLEQLFTWDRRDHALEPKRGFLLSLGLQEGGGPLQGDFTYLRALPDARAYYSFGPDDDLTLSARLRVGGLWTGSGNPDDSAVITRFYAGGAVSMRGFNDRRLSPLLLAPAPNNPAVMLTVPIGGNGMVEGSFEARYTITPSVRLAGFVDFGEVTRGPFSPGDIPGLLWAAGLGLRYLTPIGPIRVDVAYRLPFGTLPGLYTVNPAGVIEPVPYDAAGGCFGFGSSASLVTDGNCVLHIAIGEAF
jgi:translocation and assembly module TamA